MSKKMDELKQKLLELAKGPGGLPMLDAEKVAPWPDVVLALTELEQDGKVMRQMVEKPMAKDELVRAGQKWERHYMAAPVVEAEKPVSQ